MVLHIFKSIYISCTCSKVILVLSLSGFVVMGDLACKESLEEKSKDDDWCSLSDEKLGDAMDQTLTCSLLNNDTPSAKLRCKFGMEFNNGKFVDTSGNPFQFDANNGNHALNQARYEAIGQMVTEIVYELLETEGRLMRYPMKPEHSSRSGSFIFISPDLHRYDKLLVLIHGTGAVRAGQWARRLILNDHLDSGTQLPYIKEAQARGYGVIVLNTNHNTDEFGRIPGHQSPEAHGETVWTEIIDPTKASAIAIVAHSYAGAVVSNLLRSHLPEFRNRVKAIALTDAMLYAQNRKARKYTARVSCNWVTNHQPVGTHLHDDGTTVKVSAGTLQHEETSWMAFKDVFEFIENKFAKKSESKMAANFDIHTS